MAICLRLASQSPTAQARSQAPSLNFITVEEKAHLNDNDVNCLGSTLQKEDPNSTHSFWGLPGRQVSTRQAGWLLLSRPPLAVKEGEPEAQSLREEASSRACSQPVTGPRWHRPIPTGAGWVTCPQPLPVSPPARTPSEAPALPRWSLFFSPLFL